MTGAWTDPNVPILRPYFDDVASSLPDPERGLADVLSQVAAMPQTRPRWRFRRRTTTPSSPPSPVPQPTSTPTTSAHVAVSPGKFQSMFSATKVILASVIVALFGGVLVMSTLTQQPSDGLPAAGVSASAATTADEATEAPTPSQEAPPVAVALADAESGVLETPIGPFEWIRVEDADLPSVFRRGLPDVMPWHDGNFALVNLDDRGSSQVWVSDDGTDWRSRSLPSFVGQDTGQLFHADGVSWLIGESAGTNPNPPRIWRSLDGESWQEIDASSWTLPGPAGLVWASGVSDVASTAGVMVAIESPSARFPTRRVGVPVKCHQESLEKRGPGLYEVVFGTGGPKPKCQDGRTLLRFVERDGGLVVRDGASGRRYGRIAGAELSDIDRFAKGPYTEYGTRIVAVGEAGATLVDPPFPAQGATLFAAGDAFYAFVSRPMSVWRTTDGISWTDLGPPDLPGGVPQGSEPRAQPSPGGMTLVVWERRDGYSAIAAAWDTVDGVTWQPMPTGWPEGTEPVRLASGWFATEVIDGRHGRERGGSIWMHAGGEWVSLAELGLGCADPAGSSVVGLDAAGSTTLFRAKSGCREDVPEAIWILKPMSLE